MRRLAALRYLVPAALLAAFIACGGASDPAPAPTIAATAAGTPVPTATIAPPIASPGPTPSATATAPLPSVDVLSATAIAHIRQLSENLAPRTSATDGERAAAIYIRDQLASYGYGTALQKFPVQQLPREGDFITTRGALVETITGRVINGSGAGEVSGPLVFSGLGRKDEIPEGGLDGAVALIERGIIPFSEKVRNVIAAGAVGAVIFNNDQGLFFGTLGERMGLPAVGVSRADGQLLARSLKDGPLTANMRLVADVLESRNVVATKPGGTGDIVVMGGHYDAVPGSPAANDNGSGTAIALTVAEQLATMELPFELRVILFGSEELGLLGSANYVSTLSPDELSRITLMLNLDTVGAGQLQVIGDQPLVDAAIEIGGAEGISVSRGVIPPGASSDHATFQAAGVPVIFLVGSGIGGADTPQDTVDRVRQELLGEAALVSLRGLTGSLIDAAAAASTR